MNTQEMEIAIVKHFNCRQNLIVPNVWWALNLSYEADLLILSGSGWATEIEIKVSKADIKKDLSKSPRAHKSRLFKRFYYAVPESLIGCEYLPKNEGLLSVYKYGQQFKVRVVRPSKINKNAVKLNSMQINKLYQISNMRMWNLKQKLLTRISN